jgi:hypothetical protein
MKQKIKNHLTGIGCLLIVWIILGILYIILSKIS